MLSFGFVEVFGSEENCKAAGELEKTIEELNKQIQLIRVKCGSLNDLCASQIAFLIKDREAVHQEYEKERGRLTSEVNVLLERYLAN